MSDDLRNRPRLAGNEVILEQAFDGGSLYALRAAVAAHATEAGLPPGRVSDVTMAAHELAANAVRHGGGHGWLRLWRQGKMLVCQVTDDGDGPAPGTPPVSGPARVSVEPGHGLWLVRQLADQAGLVFGSRGSTATASFALEPPEVAKPFRLIQHAERGCTVLAVTGPLEHLPGRQLTYAVAALLAAVPGALVVLDLADLTSFDSSGAAALLTAQRHVNASPPARMILAGLARPLRQRLRDTGPGRRLAFADTTEGAITALTRPG